MADKSEGMSVGTADKPGFFTGFDGGRQNVITREAGFEFTSEDVLRPNLKRQ